MINWIGASILVVVFIGCMHLIRLVPLAKQVFGLARRASDILSDSDLDDLGKEKQLQSLALTLFGKFLLILLGSGVCLALPVLCVWGLEWFGFLRLDNVLKLTLSWPFIVLTTLLFGLIWGLGRRGQANGIKDQVKDQAFENRYNMLDQTLHKLAFSMVPTQVALAGLEDRLFRQRIVSGDQVERPVFITALPRAGTTLLLDLLYETGEFATHTYRHMPFLLIPLFWRQLSQHFKHDDQPRERAHGDGMLVSVDSPEAFEEIIWKAFWKKHYGPDRISPWAGKKNSTDFDTFYRAHIRKIITIDQQASEFPKRYISKNNLNIARILYLKNLFPQATIIVPVRHPLKHVNSLLRQHQNFLSIHAQDLFAQRYMRDIGHFDFGRNIRPVNFGHWLEQNSDLKPEQLDFWLNYWYQAYTFLLSKRESLVFFDYDHFCENSRDGAVYLGQTAGVRNIAKLQQLAQRVAVKERPILANSGPDSPIFQSCLALYRDLQAHSVNH
jgi:hypothetical protein